MGKKRIKAIGAEQEQSKKKKTGKGSFLKEKTIIKTGKGQGRLADIGQEALAEAKAIEEKEKKLEKELSQKAKKETKAVKRHGAKYIKAKEKVNREKSYPLKEALRLLKETSISKFKGSVEIHFNVKEVGLKGEIEFPHPAGKQQVIRIADEKLIKELEQGKINFTILISNSKMMPKLAKFAKLLGPRGLMPNPKTGTISEEPEKLAQEIGKKTFFKTESKAPLIHLIIGKVDDSEKNLEENFQALIKAVSKKNIKKTVIAASMGPGIKIDPSKI